MTLRFDESATATLYTLAQMYDVGNQFVAAMNGKRSPYIGLPRTFEEYVRRLYGSPSPDRFLMLNYGLLAAVLTGIVAVIGWLA